MATLDKVYENGKARVIDIPRGMGLRQRLGQMDPSDVITQLRYGALRRTHFNRSSRESSCIKVGGLPPG